MKAAALNLRHVRALAATVRTRGVGAAAQEIGVSQPAVTQAIGKLEATTGVKLLERSSSGVTPTDGGILLAARAEAAAAALADAFRSYRRGGTGGRTGADRDLTMAQLQALLAVADGGSYAAGAAATGLALPTLHRAVGDLERLCGVNLIERQGRGIALTGAGTRLARACRLALVELQAGLDELAVLAGRDQGAIRIAAVPAATARLLPLAAARFLTQHPPVRIEIEPADSGAEERLRDGRLDALIRLDDGLGAKFETAPLMDVQLRIVARAGHPLAGAPSIGLVRLSGFGWALPPAGTDERSSWEKMFLDGGLYPPAVGVTCAAPEALRSLVAESDLLTLLSSEALEASGDTRLTSIGDPMPGSRRPLVLATRRGWFPTPAQATFLEEIRARAAAFASF